MQQRDDRDQSDAREQGLKEIQRKFRRIRDEVLLRTNFPEKTLTETGTRGQDRVMLRPAACLEGAPLEACIRAAAAFGPDGEPVARRFREGRSPRRRLRDIGVDVTAEDRTAFDSRPGLADAAIRMHWHHWADEREETSAWLERTTTADPAAVPWAEQIGERLLELSRSAVAPFFTLLGSRVAEGAGDSGSGDLHGREGAHSGNLPPRAGGAARQAGATVKIR